MPGPIEPRRHGPRSELELDHRKGSDPSEKPLLPPLPPLSMGPISPEPPITPPRPRRRRLLFDRRYGWIFDEWKEPSAEALAGGRGMFCVLPIAENLLKVASHSINIAAESLVKAVENYVHFSHQPTNSNPSSWSQTLTDSAQRVDLKLLTPQRDYSLERPQTFTQ